MADPIPPGEYCFLWIDHWSTCMPRVEWSAWTQAIGAIVALIVAVGIAWEQARDLRRTQLAHAGLLVDGALGVIDHHVEQLRLLIAAHTVGMDSKFLRNAVQPLEGILGTPLPKIAVARVVAARQLVLTLADCVDGWTGRPKGRCTDMKVALDMVQGHVSAIRNRKR
jgi:hypothetical protein